MWEGYSWQEKLLMLEAETTVMVHLLADDDALVRMIRQGASKEACLAYVNENW